MYKLSAVSYLNTKPFLLGLENSPLKEVINLELAIPSKTAAHLIEGKVDIGLVPIAILPQLPQYEIITDYCIGAVGAVKTVAIYSQVPLQQVKTVYLDYHSRTSIRLAQILCEHYWQIYPNFLPAFNGYEDKIKGDAAGVIIGDRAIRLAKDYQYEYDLAEAWQEFTGLPFVFAAWVARKKITSDFVEGLNDAFRNGMSNIEEVAASYQSQYPNFDVLTYLQKHISYDLDASKREALELFLNYIESDVPELV
ncbi:MAG: menaquinone biosynthesis protein [Chitinophagales bacterium]